MLSCVAVALTLGPATVHAAPLEAQDAMVRGQRLVYVDATGTALVARDLATDREAWRVPLGEPAAASVLHVLDEDVVMVQQLGQAYTSVDTSTGDVVHQRSSPRRWTFVHRGMGGCGLVSDCALQPIDCRDGRPLGALLGGPTVKFWIDGQHTDPVCTDEPTVWGAAAGMTLVRDTGGNEPRVVALGPDGPLWSSPHPSCDDCEPVGAGIAPDGSLCWSTDRVGDERVEVKAFSCTTGALGFQGTWAVTRRSPYVGVLVGWAPGLLLVVHGRGAVAIDGATGQQRWRTELPAGELAVVPGLRLPSWPLDLAADSLVELDPASGAVTRRHAVADGQVVNVVGGELRIEPVGRSGGRGGGQHVAPLVQFAFERGRERSVARHDGVVIGHWPGDAWVVGEVAGDPGWLVVNEVRAAVDRLHVLAAPSPITPP